MDFQIKLKSGKILRGIIKSPGEKVRACIILVHGIGEHVGRYKHWIDRFYENGYGFVGVDLPGHGRSDGKRGHINNYSTTSEMLDLLITEYKKTFPGVPVFVYGHSLGGGIVLHYILSKKPRINGAIVTSPWLRLPYEPNKIKVWLAKVMKNIFPSLTQPSGLKVNYISHDQGIVDAYKADPLNHDKISVGLFRSATEAAQFSLQNAADLNIHLLLMHGSDDQLTSPQGSREFAAKTVMADLKIWEGGYHELHNELFKDEVFSYILQWIEVQIQNKNAV
jgi:acylglycerol lipase